MSAANYLPTEEQLLCCICLEVFTDPVTLPCGHNFCKNCITQHFKFNSQHQCPMCNKQVTRKCKLGVNTVISEMAVKFRESAGRKASNSSEQYDASPRDVSSVAPTGTQQTTLKFFLLALALVCLITVCFQVNVELLKTVSSPKTHQPIQNKASSTCPQHGKPLELYCKNEQMSICRSCADESHRFHDVVPLKEEYGVKKRELWKTDAEMRQKILERQRKEQEIKHWVWVSKEAADRKTASGVQVFTMLMQSLERAQAELIGTIDAKQKTSQTQAKGFTQELEQDISALTRWRVKVKQLLQSKDYLHFLQSFPSANAAPLTRDLPEVQAASYEGIMRSALATAADQLMEIVGKLNEAELKSVQLNAMDVTLDPDTAHPNLILSGDGKQVHFGDVTKKLPDNAKRFDNRRFVLGKESFSSGKFYYDVKVTGKTLWVLGVIQESVSRKGRLQLNPENGVWALFHMLGHQYFALTSPLGPLSVNNRPENVRVLVDYEEGRVSFYDLDAAALIYSFTGCSFTEKLYPLFGPGFIDSVPLIISPVSQYRLN